MKTLCKSRNDKKLFGVCGGIADYFGIDSTLVRIITVLLVAVGGMSLWVYIIAALLMK
ncbi:MAG: PspC domain-containing protein [Lachnospiraceae bacterium]|nr:PspC domain-containing protein [Lachnospiraceae bacterium]